MGELAWKNYVTGEIDNGPVKDEDYVNYLQQFPSVLGLYRAHVLAGQTALRAYILTMEYMANGKAKHEL